MFRFVLHHYYINSCISIFFVFVFLINSKDETKQDLFHFPDDPKGRRAQPHTLLFSNVKSESNKGILWGWPRNAGSHCET